MECTGAFKEPEAVAEQKKPEADWEEMEQVGPYQLQEQVAQEEYSRGELYRATHETSGATALVLKPPAGDEKPPVGLNDCRVRFISSADPNYFALEVEHTTMSVAPDRHSVESLVCTLEDVREGVGRMDQALHASSESRPWWRLALSGATALVVVLLPATLAPVSEGRVQEEAAEDVWATDVYVDPIPGRAGDAPRPVKNQKRAPCTEGLEVEVSGACWLSVAQRPCPPQTRAYQGQCLLPVAVPRPPVTSLDGGGGSEPR
ncbi:hypothetical protein JRI60_36135 [Archangium violaceum]|uniref:hypothetical protein n=1 Tax=Archangium violaceum TaxID=83451 RepID=UPI00194F8959|nr:hypothetical protein [Archangium violaceum]QRN94519.1 hypothetical protein JRI60_36135 [Archangium violaceum]